MINMNKKIILIMMFLLILAGAILLLYFNFFNQRITGEAIIDSYSYTKAICNGTNYCQDYEIICRNGEVISQNPLTGAVVQNSFDWEDPRDRGVIGRLC